MGDDRLKEGMTKTDKWPTFGKSLAIFVIFVAPEELQENVSQKIF